MRFAVPLFFACLACHMLRMAARSRRSAKARRLLERHDAAPWRRGAGGGGGVDPSGAAALFLARLELTAPVRGVRAAVEGALPGVPWRFFRAAWISGALLVPPLAVAVSGHWAALPVAGVLAACSPLAVPRLVTGRIARLEREGLDRFAAEIALMLQCGLAVEEAFDSCAGEAAPCVRGALERLNREMAISGESLSALGRFAAGCPSDDLRLVAGAAVAARETGADMRPVMADIGEAVRERARIRRDLLTQTVQGRSSGHIVSALPLLFLAISALVSGGTLEVLFGTLPGLVMLVSATVLDVAGLLWIRKILEIEL